jgi:hypothetical protein
LIDFIACEAFQFFGASWAADKTLFRSQVCDPKPRLRRGFGVFICQSIAQTTDFGNGFTSDFGNVESPIWAKKHNPLRHFNSKVKANNILQIQYYKDFASMKIVSTFVIATGITVIYIAINYEVLQPRIGIGSIETN